MERFVDIDTIERVKKACDADDAVVCLHHDNALYFYHMGKEAEIQNIKEIEHAAVVTALNNHTPLIVNDVTNCFMYNKQVDNPFKFKVQNISFLPLYKESSATCMVGCIIMYQANGSKKTFHKKDFEIIQKKISPICLKPDYTSTQEESSPCIETKSSEILEYKLQTAYQFFSSVIHDIRTPIGAIMGFLELMEKDISDPTLKEYIYATYRSSEMIAALVNDVLDFTKIESGKLEIDRHYFAPIEEFENIAMMFYHTARKKQVNFTIYYDVNIPYIILSDPYRIKQILNNFISNAIKFTPQDGEVNVSFQYDKTEDKLHIDVSDTGPGISQDAIEQIFQPFQQASKRTSGQYGGTGLGLTISKQLADLLGATLEVASEEGKGSTFSLIVPCHTVEGTPPSINREKLTFISQVPIYSIKGELTDIDYQNHVKRYFDALGFDLKIVSRNELATIEKGSIVICVEKRYALSYFELCYQQFTPQLILIEPSMFMESSSSFGEARLLHRPLFPHKLFNTIAKLASMSEKTSKKEQTINQTKREPLNVLVADDNIINRKLMQEVLKKYNAVPYPAADGREAVEIFKENAIDIILIDEQMPEMDGSEAIKIIRKTEKGKEVPIYSLTGASEENTVDKIRQAGVTDILLKPVRNEKIQEILSAVS